MGQNTVATKKYFSKFLTPKHGKFGLVSNKIVVIKKFKNSLKNTKYLCIF